MRLLSAVVAAAVSVVLSLGSAGLAESSVREIDFMYGMDESVFHPTLTTGGNGNGEFQVNQSINQSITQSINRSLDIDRQSVVVVIGVL
jgi:hypothetical protein